MKIGKVFSWLREKEGDPSTLLLITEQLYLHGGRSLRFLLVVIWLLVLLIADKVPGGLLYGWSTLLSFLLLYRLYDLMRYRDRLGGGMNPAAIVGWYRRFRNLALVTALLTGLSAPLFFPYLDEPFRRFLLLFFLIGVSAGALAALFPSGWLVRSYLLLMNIPFFLYLICRDEPYALVSALVLVLFIFILLLIAQNSRGFMFQAWKRQKRLEAKERELYALFEQTPTPIFYYDTRLRVRKFNRAFQEFFRIPPQLQLEDFDLGQLQHRQAVEIMKKVLETREPQEYNGYYLSTFNPQQYWILAKIAPLFNEEGVLIGGIVSFQDKTMEKESIEHLEQLASHDLLTDLGNRRSFFHTLNELVSAENHEKLSLLFFIDLDQFKPINDTLGHHTGDRVLQEVAGVLKRITGEEGKTFRHGGDEFVALFPHCCREEEEARRWGRHFIRRLDRALEKEIVVEGFHLPIRCSVGIVVISPEMRDSDEIIRQADISMYQAKNAREKLAFYDPTMDRERQKSFFLRQGLNRAEIENQLELYFQPIVSLENQAIVGAEALIRWRHPTLGLLGAADFIPLAVESGEIGKIGRWVGRQVCQTLLEIRQEFTTMPLNYLSFNIDAREINYENFPDYLESLIEAYGIGPGELVLEITENSLIDNFLHIQETLARLHDTGALWAIDDFGTGYSSLSYLERLSFDILKIDQSFTRNLLKKEESAFLVEHIIQIAQHLGYHVVVEGVENGEQLSRLRQIHPQLLCQGYYYSPPLEKEEFFSLLREPELPYSAFPSESESE